MFKERNQCCGNGYNLSWRHIDVVHLVRKGHGGFVQVTSCHHVINQFTLFIKCDIRLGNHVLTFFNGRQVFNITRHYTIDHFTIWCFQKTVIIGTRIHSQRVNQPDIWAFRRFDRADTAVMRRMHIAHLKTSAFASQAAWAQGRNTALMGDFRQRIVLIHKLRQLRTTKKLLDGSRYRLGID